MDWVTRQMEEVVNKLTDLPKIFVILPDFSGIFEDGWSTFNEGLTESFEESKKQRGNTSQAYDNQLKILAAQKATLNCDINPLGCRTLDSQISTLE